MYKKKVMRRIFGPI